MSYTGSWRIRGLTGEVRLWVLVARRWTMLWRKFMQGAILLLMMNLLGRIPVGVIILRNSSRKWAMGERTKILGRMVVIGEHFIVCLVEINIPGEVWEGSDVFILQRGKTMEDTRFIWEMEMATCCFHLVPHTVRCHGVLELFQVKV